MKIKYYLRGLGIGMIVTALAMSTMGGKARGMTDEEVKVRAKQLGMIEDTTLAAMASQDGDQASANEDPENSSDKGGTDKARQAVMGTPIASAGQEKDAEHAPDAGEKGTGKNTDKDASGVNSNRTDEVASDGEAHPDSDGDAVKKNTDKAQDNKEKDTESSANTEASENENGDTDKKSTESESTAAGSTSQTGKSTSDGDEQDKPDVSVTEIKNPKRYTLVIGSGTSSVTVSRQLANMGLVSSAGEYDRYLCDNGYDKNIHAGTYELHEGMTEQEIAGIITRR